MADRNVRWVSLIVLVLVVAGGAAAMMATSAPPHAVAIGAAAIALAQMVSVPAPSGERLYLGVAVAAAVPLLAPDAADTAAVFGFGMAGSLVVGQLVPSQRRNGSARFVSDMLALVALGGVYYVLEDLAIGVGSDTLFGKYPSGSSLIHAFLSMPILDKSS